MWCVAGIMSLMVATAPLAPAPPTQPASAAPAAKAPSTLPTALAGRWQLELATSDNLDALLDRLGGGFIEKQAAKVIAPVHVITAVSGGATIRSMSSFQDKTESLVFDGKTVVVGKALAKSSRTTHVIKDGAIVSTSIIGDGDDVFRIITTRRREGPKLTMTLDIVDAVRGPLKMRRVFVPAP